MKSQHGENWLTNGVIQLHSQVEKVEHCKSRILARQSNPEVRNSQLVSNLSFSFWTCMFHRKYDQLWRDGLYKIFHADRSINSKLISCLAYEQRLLRNRVVHYKVIIHLDLELKYKNCLQIIGWLSKDALIWCGQQSRFYQVHPGTKIIKDDKLNSEVDLTGYGAIESTT